MGLDIPGKERNIHFSQVWDIEPQMLEVNQSLFWVIDVRLREELSGDLSAISDSENIPLMDFIELAPAIPKEEVVVLVCRNGWRSAKAAAFLASLGCKEVYNLKGGLLFWNEYQNRKNENTDVQLKENL